MSDVIAESAVLKWCRSKPRGMGCPVMRTNKEGECLVLDVNSTEPINPTDKSPFAERRTKRLFVGKNWQEVFDQITQRYYEDLP